MKILVTGGTGYIGSHIYVVHAFEKKAQRTAQPDIELARKRFRALVNMLGHAGMRIELSVKKAA